ncbi:MAG: T9SS type A sorting domain-containing protein [Flavobacteriia bacterium]|nr:T9SS type A sorting domain-containing protein [Flavobacteriia bacterium]OIP46327.1 MAG: hypothetical protein AUK46_08910 [Flavobacteriaceae bacterium CG2_30_31_66]PIV95695.1 MAG: hypothetical protein COW43_12105 [Flavobacteriaceae bacterium CG17_big_fil_post_rev_8_21_14_2_50_31_13]PIX14203.1 MAG: hypothetical protein COZ74_03695 [Flavobacteriaceae bacterium CG_4_8_14_3_um_filter_31_8]PIY15593.1 MAG: hypothetical protein COZ16_03530 [Flavobacteriaceae bacterium CG_4_10_14_3_um_filter_31_253]
MKKNYTLLFIFLSFYAFSQGSEDFTNSTATASYADGSFVGNGGITWKYGHSRNQDIYLIDGSGLMLRRASDSYIEATIPGGIGDFTFEYRKAFTGTSERQLELLVNGVAISTSPIFGTVSGADTAVYNFTYTVNQPGSVTIRIKNIGTTTTNRQTTIDNIVWTAFSGTPIPSLTISSPANNTIYNPTVTATDVNINVLNFNVANGTGDGHIHYTVNGGSVVMKYDTTAISLTSLTPGMYTVFVELVDISHQPIVPAVNATINFSIASYVTVTDLAALRADVIANGAGKYYQVSSTPVISYARTTRNQKYIQDSTAGILIDDVSETISTTMVAGDAISSLKGQTSLFNGVLQISPLENSTVASTGNIITPQVVTTAQITANIETYESKLVQINNASFSTADGLAVFVTNTNYNLNDGSDIIFRTMLSEADYIGQVIPSGAANRVLLVAEFNGTAQVVARSLADVTLSVDSFNSIKGFATYPNPVTSDNFTITSNSAENKQVAIFNVLGEKVVSTNFTGTKSDINVANLSSGIYILKVTEGKKSATSKLIIK